MPHTLRFEIRKEALNSQGKTPISAIVSVMGKRKRFSTEMLIYPWNWNPKSQRACYKSESELKKEGVDKKVHPILLASEVDDLNGFLEGIKSKLKTIERRFQLEGTPTSSELIVETYKGSLSPSHFKEDPKSIVYDFIDLYIKDNEKTRAKGSLVVYKSLRKHLKNFEDKTKVKVRFENIDYRFMQSFQNFLVGWEEKTLKTGKIKFLNNITIAKQISTLKTFLGYAIKNGISVNESFRSFSMKKDELEVIALTSREFEGLLKLDLSKRPKLEKVRDVFCFSCATGLRYSDLKQLRWDHIKGMELFFRVQKTNQLLTVPLAPQAYEILEKYKGKLSPLPVISNQKMNDYLKDLGELAEIDELIEIVRYRGSEKIVSIYKKFELLSVHAGRKTFATLSLEKGIPAETVMSITGHKSYSSFQRYVKVTEDRKRNEMEKAWGKPVLKASSS